MEYVDVNIFDRVNKKQCNSCVVFYLHGAKAAIVVVFR